MIASGTMPRPRPSRMCLARASFRDWLRSHRFEAEKLPLPELILRYGQKISLATAYRVAVAEGVLGMRRNMTRYHRFWQLVNWELPDSLLMQIWGVSRQSLRHRRQRLGVGDAKFYGRTAVNDPKFRTAVSRERRKSSHYRGVRPH